MRAFIFAAVERFAGGRRCDAAQVLQYRPGYVDVPGSKVLAGKQMNEDSVAGGEHPGQVGSNSAAGDWIEKLVLRPEAHGCVGVRLAADRCMTWKHCPRGRAIVRAARQRSPR